MTLNCLWGAARLVRGSRDSEEPGEEAGGAAPCKPCTCAITEYISNRMQQRDYMVTIKLPPVASACSELLQALAAVETGRHMKSCLHGFWPMACTISYVTGDAGQYMLRRYI